MGRYDGAGNALPMGNDFIPRNMKVQSIDTNRFDPMIREKIQRINAQKHAAVEDEDFDQAKYYKAIIDKLKVVGNQLLMLRQEKEIAIENEDYDLAKTCKAQIDGITQLAYEIGEPERPAKHMQPPQ